MSKVDYGIIGLELEKIHIVLPLKIFNLADLTQFISIFRQSSIYFNFSLKL